MHRTCPLVFGINQNRKFRERGCRFVILGLVLALASIIGASCTSNGTTNPSETSPDHLNDLAASASQSGNLHYQNLVLASGGNIIFVSSAGVLSLAATDGSGQSALADHAGSYLASDGSRLFYIDQEHNLSKVNLDGSGQVRIGQTALKYLICAGDWLYAIEEDKGIPVRLQKDGTGRAVLSNLPALSLAMGDGQLFITGSDEETGLSAIDLASGDMEQLLGLRVTSLNVSGEWLYFSVPSDGYRLHAWSAGQREAQAISSFSVDKPFVVNAGFLYYISTDDQSRLYRVRVSGKESLNRQKPELIVDDLVESFVVIGEAVYYQRPSSSRIYRISTIDRRIVRIT